MSQELSNQAPASPSKPAPKKARKPKAEAQSEAHAAAVSATAALVGAPKSALKPAAKKAAPKVNAKQVFLEHVLELHCCLAETAQIIDQFWGKSLAKMAPYEQGPEGDGDEEAIDED